MSTNDLRRLRRTGIRALFLRGACLAAAAPLALAQEPPGGEGREDPASERGLILRTDGACEGYTLFAPLRSKTTYLIDLDGEVVHEWESDRPPGNSVYLLDDGRLLRSGQESNQTFRGGGEGGHIQELAWDGTVLWDFSCSDESWRQHHDIEPLPNGNVLVIAWEGMSREEALAAGRDPEHLSEGGMWPDFVAEVRPVRPDGGEVVWEWHVRDHLIQDLDPERAGYGDVTAHPELVDFNGDHRTSPPMSAADRKRQEELERRMRGLGYIGEDDEEEVEEQDEEAAGGGRRRGGRGGRGGDWLHTNSIDYHPELDLVLLSVHRFNEVWVIDHSTSTEEAAGHAGGRWGKGGDLLYRWGNPRAYGRGAREDQQLFHQHDARWLAADESGALGVLIFNNGGDRPGGSWSSVDELALPLDPDRGFELSAGGAFGPVAPRWSYTAPVEQDFFATFISGAQRLPNGNTLVCSGPDGRLFEVTGEGQVVWEYHNPFGGDAPMGGRGGGPPGGRGERRGPPPGGGPPQGGGPPGGRGGRGGRGGGGPAPVALFRGTRIPPDHPGLAGKDLR